MPPPHFNSILVHVLTLYITTGIFGKSASCTSLAVASTKCGYLLGKILFTTTNVHFNVLYKLSWVMHLIKVAIRIAKVLICVVATGCCCCCRIYNRFQVAQLLKEIVIKLMLFLYKEEM